MTRADLRKKFADELTLMLGRKVSRNTDLVNKMVDIAEEHLISYVGEDNIREKRPRSSGAPDETERNLINGTSIEPGIQSLNYS